MFVTAALAADAAPKAVFPAFDATTFPSQLIWLAIAFGALYFSVARVVVPGLGGVIEARRARIAQDLDDAAALKLKADTAIQAYEKSLADAKAKAQAIAQARRDEVSAASDARRKATEAALAAKLASAEAAISTRKAEALTHVRSIAEVAVTAVVARLGGAAPSDADLKTALDTAARR